MENYQKTIKSRFSFLSKFYDIFEVVFIFNKKTNPRYGLAEKIPNQALHILDVCTGTANGSLLIAGNNPKNKIIGIDLSSDMLTVAQNKAKKKGIKNISFQQMDATRMDFENNKFDIATISFGLHELEYDLMMKTIKEMSRVLKDGGKLYIIDCEKQNNPVKNAVLSIFVKIFEPPHMPQFLQYNWENILKDTGFDNVKIEKYFFSKLILANKSIQRTKNVIPGTQSGRENN